MKGLTKQCDVHFTRGQRTCKVIQEGPPPVPAPEGTIPRISRLMALAIRFDRLIKAREINDQADLARLGSVTRARVTQIMNLLHLAPDIQEAILFLPRTVNGRDSIREIMVRPIAAEPDWRKQRRFWKCLMFDRSGDSSRQVGAEAKDATPSWSGGLHSDATNEPRGDSPMTNAADGGCSGSATSR